jgi:hypothetical protein
LGQAPPLSDDITGNEMPEAKQDSPNYFMPCLIAIVIISIILAIVLLTIAEARESTHFFEYGCARARPNREKEAENGEEKADFKGRTRGYRSDSGNPWRDIAAGHC